MNIVDKTTRIESPTTLNFTIGSEGWYAVVVSARLKSKSQNEVNHSNEDLNIGIDNLRFPPAVFSGGKLKNKLQTIYLIINFSIGNHKLIFDTKKGATVESAEFNCLPDFPELYFNLNQQAEQSSGRPWLTFVLVNLSLESFSIKAKVKWRFPDGDDIKIILDGQIKKNSASILHKNWIFASSILKKLFGREIVEKTFEEKLLVSNIHYLEFWSDETPSIEYLKFIFKSSAEAKDNVRKYKSPQGEDYNRFDSNVWKFVQKWNDEFLSQESPPPEPLNPDLVKAIMYVESRVGYGISTGYPSYPDIMQIADQRNPAIHTLNNDGWIDPATEKVAQEFEWVNGKPEILDYKGDVNGATFEESINWGVRWLYHKAQGILENGGRYWRSWEEAVAAYNGEGDQDYQKKVFKIFKEGVDPQGIKLWSFLIILFLGISILAGVFIYSRQGRFYAYREAIKGTGDYQFYVATLDGFIIKSFPFSYYYDNGRITWAFFEKETKIRPINLSLGSKNSKVFTIWGKDTIDYDIVSILSYSDGRFRIVPKFNEENWPENTFQGKEVVIKNIDGDPEDEIIQRDFIPYSNAKEEVWQDVYDFDKKTGVYIFEKRVKTYFGQQLI